MNSTFLNRAPVFAVKDFIGRREDVEWVRNMLGRQTPQNCNLIGEPRVGKTSLLYYIYKQKIGLLPSQKGLYVWVRLAELPDRNSLTFWRYMLKSLLVEEEINGFIQKPRGRKESLWEVFDELNLEIGWLCKEDSYQRIIFLIDDFELLTEDIDAKDLDWLRSLATRYSNYLAFVITSTTSLPTLIKGFYETTVSPFVNLFHNRSLGLLAMQEAVELIRNAAKAESLWSLNDEDIKFLLSEAGRHPDLLKVMCGYLFEAKQISYVNRPEELYEDIKSDIRYDGHVCWLCERLIERRTDEEQQALWLLAKGDIDIERIVLRRLERHLGLVEERYGKPALFADAFEYWVSRRVKWLPQKTIQAVETKLMEYLPDQRLVRVGNQLVSLTSLENLLLSYLVDNAHRVCTTDELLENVWGMGKSKSVVEKAINRLRIKVEIDPQKPRHIISVRGEGYILRNKVDKWDIAGIRQSSSEGKIKMTIPEQQQFAITVLTQAVGFLFDEARKILAERRQRRQEMQEPDDTAALPAGVEESDKETVLKLKPGNLDKQTQEEIDHLFKLIKIQTDHRRKAEIKINKLGGILFVPPNVRVELEHPEDEILKYTQRLKKLLEKVYNRPIYIDGLE